MKLETSKPRGYPLFLLFGFLGFTLYHFFPKELSLGKEILRREEARVEVLEEITMEKTHRVIF